MKTLFILPLLFACSSTSITQVSATEPDAGFDGAGGSNSTSTSSSVSGGPNVSTGGQNNSTGGNLATGSSSTGSSSGVCVPISNPCETKDYQVENSAGTGLINTNICNGTIINDNCGNPVTCGTSACDMIGMTNPPSKLSAESTLSGCVWVIKNNVITAVYFSNPNNVSVM